MNGCREVPELEDARVAVVLPAAGSGRRMGSEEPKQWLDLKGRSVIGRAFDFFDALGCVKQIVVVLSNSDLADGSRRGELQSHQDTRVDFTSGGASRQESVAKGLEQVLEDMHIVAVHDAARPFPPREAVCRAFLEAVKGGGAVLACRVVETIKRVASSGCVIETLDRSTLWSIQTPQVFPRLALIDAYQRFHDMLGDFTDDASIFEACSGRVQVVESTPDNFKITHADDLLRARRMLEEKKGMKV
jgi:2-C-methyl-D-erythritol 4-phosphate cytidylyltransferase